MIVTMRFALLALLAASLVAPAPQASAQDYPTRIVHIIAPYGPGGPSDVFSRILAQKLSDTLKQGFVVENRPGASTMIGTDAVAKAAPDGYTLLIISQTHATNESLVANKPFQLMRDFTPVSPIYTGDLVMVVHKSVPVKTLKDFIALAKAKPGTMNYASSGTGSQYHLAGELFKTMSGTDIVHVPYKGSTGARNDILGGQVEMMFDTIATMGPSVEAGLVRALGTTGEERSPILPDVPTISEAGVPGFRASGWVGIMAPAATPKPIVERLNAEIGKILNSTEIKESWAKQGVTPLSMTAPEFGAFITAEIEKWAKVAQTAGVKIN
ncbi:MAG TPA: tripartite tricarboxylate transporter substrate binding protein [Xanthobacteraceae bacterium]|jgi:tripartite-type tricarboxylate transporter receptor subunit TctC|nr:tripartite tricarboxylate transporter substrate binding protein [Xanthobacteraceae bacterium]